LLNTGPSERQPAPLAESLEVPSPRGIELVISQPTRERFGNLSRRNHDEVMPHLPVSVRVTEQVVQGVRDRDILIVGMFGIGPAPQHVRNLMALKPKERVELPVGKERASDSGCEALPNNLNVIV
jgi:hypothetical protein